MDKHISKIFDRSWILWIAGVASAATSSFTLRATDSNTPTPNVVEKILSITNAP